LELLLVSLLLLLLSSSTLSLSFSSFTLDIRNVVNNTGKLFFLFSRYKHLVILRVSSRPYLCMAWNIFFSYTCNSKRCCTKACSIICANYYLFQSHISLISCTKFTYLFPFCILLLNGIAIVNQTYIFFTFLLSYNSVSDLFDIM
jgi:hypothetical protein